MRAGFKTTVRTLLCSGLSVSAMGFAMAAHAQTGAATTAADEGEMLAEVIVTATRQTQTLQKTAAAVTVLTADALEKANVTGMEDVGRLVPNLSFGNGYRAGIPNVTLRGIPTAQGGEAPVAFIIDGAQAPSVDFINQSLLDLQSVQVLSGPQGALYGRGAIGGAIIVTTKQPTDEIEGSLTGVYGNGDLGRVTARLSGPIVPGKLWAGLTLVGKTYEGLIDDVGLGKPGDWSREQAGRLQVLYKPTEATTVSLSWSRTRSTDGASYIELVPAGGIEDFSNYRPSRNVNTRDRRKIDSWVARIDHETDAGTITSISQYARAKSTVSGDADWSTAPIALQFNPTRVAAFNEDLRFTSPVGERLQWLVGAFYQYRDSTNFLDVTGEPGGPLGGLTLLHAEQNSKSFAYAAYAQASYDFDGGVKLTGAVRYDIDDRYDNDKLIAGSTIRKRFSAFQPSVTASKQWTDDVLTYATIGKGFRSGGFNPIQDTFAFPGVVQREYPAETNLNYEAGFKSQWLDRRLTINGSAYHAEYKNEQYFLVNISPPARDIVTLRRVEINGGELSAVFTPQRGITVGGDVGLAYSRIKSDDGIGAEGKRSPNAPLYTANAFFQYERPAFADYDFSFRADYGLRGPVYYDPANTEKFDRVGNLNLRAALDNGVYTFAVWGKNVTDERFPQYLYPNNFGPNVSGRISNTPASYGVELRYAF